MANAMYSLAKQEFLRGEQAYQTDLYRVVLIDTAVYTFSAAHTSYDDIASAVIGTESGLLTSKTTAAGVGGAANTTFPSVATAASVEALVVFLDTGTSADDVLICYIDDASAGLPVTPNGTDIDVNWASLEIFAI